MVLNQTLLFIISSQTKIIQAILFSYKTFLPKKYLELISLLAAGVK